MVNPINSDDPSKNANPFLAALPINTAGARNSTPPSFDTIVTKAAAQGPSTTPNTQNITQTPAATPQASPVRVHHHHHHHHHGKGSQPNIANRGLVTPQTSDNGTASAGTANNRNLNTLA